MFRSRFAATKIVWNACSDAISEWFSWWVAILFRVPSRLCAADDDLDESATGPNRFFARPGLALL